MMWIFLLVLVAWLVFAQNGMRYRMRDAEAITAFSKAGVLLRTAMLHTSITPLHYVQTGCDSLPTLLFVHGSPGSWIAFKQYLKDDALLKKYRMVAVDRPGFGFSSFGRAFPLQQQVQAISSLVAVLQNGHPLYLVGHSYAGPLIVALAAQHPSQVAGIVVVAGSINTADERPEQWRWLFFNTPLGLFLPGAIRTSNDEIWYLKKDLEALVPQFQKVHCAVYLMHGTNDKLVPYHNMLWGQTAFNKAARVSTATIPGAGHFLPWEHYTELKKLLLQLY